MQVLGRIVYKIRVWLAWKQLTDIHDNVRGFYRYENTITGDRRQVNPTGCPFTVNSWAAEARGQGYHYDRLAERFYKVYPVDLSEIAKCYEIKLKEYKTTHFYQRRQVHASPSRK